MIDADEHASAADSWLELQDGTLPIHYIHTRAEPDQAAQHRHRRAGGDVVVFLDDDVSLPSDLFAQARARPSPTQAVVGATGWVVEPQGSRRRAALVPAPARAAREPRARRPLHALRLPALRRDRRRAARRRVHAGLLHERAARSGRSVRFDEHLGAYALAEDEDFSYRLSRHGRVVYLPDVVVVHEKLGFRSFDSRDFGRLVVKNRAYLFRKNFPQTPLARGSSSACCW